MENLPILSIATFTPVIGIALIFLLKAISPEKADYSAKLVALTTSIITLIFTVIIAAKFDAGLEGHQFMELAEWIPNYDISYKMGIDGISLWFVVLTAVLTPICVLCSWNSIEKNIPLFNVMFLLMETLVIGVFCALDFVLFYVLFEAVLIPMFLIIGIWGGDNRIYAAFKFFLYTLLGSVLLPVGLIYIYLQVGTTDMEKLTVELPKLGLDVQKLLWLALFASFAVKVPMRPFHTWLPDAHVQAPTAGSVMLAGILLKIGGYGFLRFSLPMLPEASSFFVPYVFILSAVAVVYTSLVALVQTDMKKLIAYSSVAHMGFVTIGIFTFNQQAIDGAIFQMISHGIVSAALFLCVGVLYDRLHTKEIALYGGLVNKMPAFAFLFVIFTMASIGLPATRGFVGEFLVLLGTYSVSKKITIVASLGVILGAAYMLWLTKRVVFGEIHNKKIEKISDVDNNEKSYLWFLAIFTVAIGIYPSFILNQVSPAVETLLQQTKFIPIDKQENNKLGNIMIDAEETEETPDDEKAYVPETGEADTQNKDTEKNSQDSDMRE